MTATTDQVFDALSDANGALRLAVRSVVANRMDMVTKLDAALAQVENLKTQGQTQLEYGPDIKLRVLVQTAHESSATLQAEAKTLADLAAKATAAVPGLTTAAEQLHNIAKALVEKDSELTAAMSISKAMQLRPDLVAEDRAERGFGH